MVLVVKTVLEREMVVDHSRKKLVDPNVSLVERTGLRYLRIYSQVNVILLYDWDDTVYKELKESELETLVTFLFIRAGVPPFPDYVRSVISNLKKIDSVSFPGEPDSDIHRECLLLSDGVYNGRIGKFTKFSPHSFVTKRYMESCRVDEESLLDYGDTLSDSTMDDTCFLDDLSPSVVFI
jgi:hypothetical protein